jgi:hypothetical protein
LELVRFIGNPASTAANKISASPLRAASNIRLAKSSLEETSRISEIACYQNQTIADVSCGKALTSGFEAFEGE